jgi:ribonuclease III
MDSGEVEPGIETPEELANRLKLPFKDGLLLSRALTHRSFLNEHPEALEDNERLEFLGDAVLDFLVAAWLYNRFPEMLEGDLTRMRSALVHTERLADYALKIDLGRAMRLGKGESLSGGNRRMPLLCDTFEAVVGALYLDSGFESVLTFMVPLLDQASDDILANNQLDDPKSSLQEWAQAQGISTPQYVIKNSTGPEHSKIFEVDVVVNGEVIGTGTGRSKQTAAKEAAQKAMKRLGIDPCT